MCDPERSGNEPLRYVGDYGTKNYRGPGGGPPNLLLITPAAARRSMMALGRMVVRGILGVLWFILALPALVILSLAAMYADRRVIQ